jgi:hypothetical protein
VTVKTVCLDAVDVCLSDRGSVCHMQQTSTVCLRPEHGTRTVNMQVLSPGRPAPHILPDACEKPLASLAHPNLYNNII